MLKLECLGAMDGDCLVLHYRNDGVDYKILFDGGPAGVYDAYLKPWLEQRATEDGPPKFKLGMVTHIDDDHINGILDLMNEMVEAKTNGVQMPAEFDAFWFNSFSGLTGGGHAAENTASVTASIAAPNFDASNFADVRTEEIIASIKQGHELSNLLGELGLGGNGSFNDIVRATKKVTVAPA